MNLISKAISVVNRFFVALLLTAGTQICYADDITGTSNYFGPIRGVGVGFFGHVGVVLPEGQTCHGKTVVVLLTTNARYKEILSALLLAEAGKQSVRLSQIGAVWNRAHQVVARQGGRA